MKEIITFTVAGFLVLAIVGPIYSQDTLWTRTYGGGSTDEAYAVWHNDDGGYVLAGMTDSFGAINQDMYLVRTDSLGDTLWTRMYGGTVSERATGAQQTADGGFVAAGWTSSYGSGLWEYYLVKMDAAGDTTWTATYGGADEDKAEDVIQTSDGGYALTGSALSFGARVRPIAGS